MIKNIINSLSNLPGWRTNRKIVVIESDDWGSLRSPSPDSLKLMQKKGLPLGDSDNIRFNKYDALARREDLENLFEVLSSYADKNKNAPVITALSLVANPDFKKIEADNFSKYYYKTHPEFLEEVNQADAWSLWEEGRKHRLFIPEYHGREHLNVNAWMRALQNKDSFARIGFRHQFWGFRQENTLSYQAAFDLEIVEDLKEQQDVLREGLNIFELLHEQKARFFVPPNGLWNNKLEKTAAECGIEYFSTPKIQYESIGRGKTKKHYRYIGKKNKYKQIYLTRNAFFEPSSNKKADWVDACLKQIETAFRYKKPATISTHRVNYIGLRNSQNSFQGLQELSRLLKRITDTWPDVEFMTSSELGDNILTYKK